MSREPEPTRTLRGLPEAKPFVAPEALERRTGHPLRLRLGANESLFGASPEARQAMISAAETGCLYGDPDNHELRVELAGLHGVAAEEVLVGAGIDEVLGMAVRCYLDQGQAAVSSRGTYPMFPYHVRGYGGRLHTVEYRDDRNDVEALATVAREVRAAVAYVANPDNPSGSQLGRGELDRLVTALPEGCLLVLDEAYAEFGDPIELPPPSPVRPGIIRLRTFSKAYGLAGARVGYAIASAAALAVLEKIRLHFGVNRIGQAGALAALRDRAHVEAVVRAVEEGRRHYAELAEAAGLRALPSHTNFVAIDAGSRRRAEALREALLRRGVFIRIPWAPPLDRCIRVAVSTREDRELFGRLLGEALAEV
jgi:histidinol-phosphate aminotransferase